MSLSEPRRNALIHSLECDYAPQFIITPAESQPMGKPVIGIFGHYGHENLGDEAIIESCVQRLQEHFPGAELRLYSARPMDSSSRYGLAAYPIKRIAANALSPREQIAREKSRDIDYTGRAGARPLERNPVKRALKQAPFLWGILKGISRLPSAVADIFREAGFLWRSRGPLKELDLLMVTGSNQFLDNFGGPWGFPYTLLKWTVLARSAGVRVAFVSVGAGPLDSPLSHRMIRFAIRHACYLSFRDEASRSLVDPDNRFQGSVFPDLAFAIDKPTYAAPGRVDDAENPVIAINPMAVYDARYWYIKDPERYRAYVDKMTEFVAVLLDEGFSPKLFATQVKDENVINDIVIRLADQGRDRRVVDSLFVRIDTVADLLTFLCNADIVVPTRFHGTVLALWAGKPTIGVCYYRKAFDLLEFFGQAQYAFDLDAVTAGELRSTLATAIADRDKIAARIQATSSDIRTALRRQFEILADAANLSRQS